MGMPLKKPKTCKMIAFEVEWKIKFKKIG